MHDSVVCFYFWKYSFNLHLLVHLRVVILIVVSGEVHKPSFSLFLGRTRAMAYTTQSLERFRLLAEVLRDMFIGPL
jgi:hypothetical protein